MASLEASLSVRRREEVRVGIDSLGAHVGNGFCAIRDRNYEYKRCN